MRSWLAALALDLAAGEPREALHPVVQIGRAIDALDRADAPRTVARGAIVALLPAAIAGLAGRLAPSLVRIPLLKTTFALRALLVSCAAVERALRSGDLAEARRAASRIVGRATGGLEAPHLASAAIESATENLSDSYVAPLFWYAVAGLPGALAYRAINTADAMIGHRTPRHERVGLVAARVDDVLSFVPARITAAALVVVAPVAGGSSRESLRLLRRDGGRTASPNSGRPMAAAAGALGVRLEKIDHHSLGDGPAPGADDVARARSLVLAAAALVTLGYAWLRR